MISLIARITINTLIMEELKCKMCNKNGSWFYETKNDSDFYCDEHLPCEIFKRFLGKYIIKIMKELAFYWF